MSGKEKEGSNRGQRGYALLLLLLSMALLAIAATAAGPSIAFQIKRDREEELVHRGVQYSRAIRRYAKRTGRYPLNPEDLLGDGNIRYIRKLYKDPITGKDFRLLHLGDVQAIGTTNVNKTGEAAAGNQENTQADQSTPESDQGETSRPGDAAPDTKPAQPSGGGLLIFGVVSSSHAQTIREYNHKNHYNQWLFFYDVRSDQGREIKGPTPLAPLPTALAQSPGENRPGSEAPAGTQQPPQ